LLGLLITWLLAYMLGASFLAFWSACHPEPTLATVAASEVADQWAAVTGQWQGWALYGPNLPTQSAFIAVELRWDDRTVRLPSDYEPVDVTEYFRPFGSARLSIYESYLGLVLWGWNAEAAAGEPEIWNERLAAHVARECKTIHTYLRWRLKGYQHDHPDLPSPTEIVLLGHIHRIPPPGQEPFAWSTPLELPLARWRPSVGSWSGDHAPTDDQLPIETYNLITHHFDPLPRQP
jgi:hypothetical protein